MTGWLSAAELEAVLLSLRVSTVAVVASLPFGIALGWWLARRRFRGKALVETVLNLPLVLPPVVTGWLLLATFGRNGWLGRPLGIEIAFTWKGAALAAAVLAFPLMVRSIRLAFEGVDARLESAARTLGARPGRVFLTVSLPLARRGVIAGSVLAFARAMGEFGATIMLAGSIPGETRTIALFVLHRLEEPGGVAGAGRVIVVSIAIAAAALVASERLERRGRAEVER